MRAIIKFKDFNTGKNRQKTITVNEKEVNSIVREFIRQTGESKLTYINTVKCQRTEYQWFGIAGGAF